MEAAVFQLLPLGAWLGALIVITVVTWLFYRLTTHIEKNVAWLQGPVGAVTVKFGGPAALFVFLVLLSKAYIPDHTLVELTGHVTDGDGNPMPNLYVESAEYSGKTNAKGKFTVDVPYSKSGKYDLVTYDENFGYLFTHPFIEKRDAVKISDFPNPGKTEIVAKDLKDQDDNSLKNVRIFVKMIARPEYTDYEPGKVAHIGIERRKYRVVITNQDDKEIYKEDFDVQPGVKNYVPTPITVRHPN